MCCNALCLIPIATDIAKKILLGRRYDEPHLFKVRWNEHFVSCFSLIIVMESIQYITFNNQQFLV